MNRNAIKWAILGATLIALMGPTGGFPSRPTFQSVKVNGNTTTSTLNATTAGVTGTATVGTLNATTAGVTGTATVGTLNATTAGVNGLITTGALSSSGAISGVSDLNILGAGSIVQFGAGAPGNFDWGPSVVAVDIGNFGGMHGTSGDVIALDSNLTLGAAGASWMTKTAGYGAQFSLSGGGFTWNTTVLGAAKGSWVSLTPIMNLSQTGVLSVNGVAVPKVSYATCAGAGGLSVGFAVNNISACTHNSTGNYTLSFVQVYAAKPACTVSSISTYGFAVAGSNINSVNVLTTNSAAAAADISFAIICTGT